MKKIALTGSIAMGKTFIANIFKQFSVAVYDSDLAVKEIFEQQPELIAKLFPECYVDGKIDKNILSQIIFNDPQKRKKLESILHPLVAKKREIFIRREKYKRTKILVCDIALLFEKNYQRYFDQVVVASAPKFMQNKRAMARKFMTQDRLSSILKLQMPDHKKRIKADKVVYTGGNRGSVYRQIKSLLYS
ncbi:Dephospho-CoA kinase [Candidatus Arcanobacter lacustris]|uniref:Dephospho-CoA kinase n=1 Tax=Candidatus Arcanibacter lacustris TaxID=1607817 RepID=A0A0F5MQQ2_9RICK|nr:Dephospho-CoA kinase [Candidatus Arcanobacter lacustris]